MRLIGPQVRAYGPGLQAPEGSTTVATITRVAFLITTKLINPGVMPLDLFQRLSRVLRRSANPFCYEAEISHEGIPCRAAARERRRQQE